MATNRWTTGLFDCCDDCNSCCLTCFCPCISHGMLANAVNGGGECTPCCLYYLTAPCCMPVCCFGPQVRQNLRSKYGLMEAPCGGMQPSASSFTAGLVLVASHTVPQTACGIIIRFSVSGVLPNTAHESTQCQLCLADCCVHFCFHSCATCQEIRELKARGGLKGGDPNSAPVPQQEKPQPTQNSAPLSPTVNATPGSPTNPPEYDRVIQPNYLQPNSPPAPPPQPSYGYVPPQQPAPAPTPATLGYTPPPPQPPTMNYGFAPPVPPPAPAPYSTNPYVSRPAAPPPSEMYPPAARPAGNSQYPPM